MKARVASINSIVRIEPLHFQLAILNDNYHIYYGKTSGPLFYTIKMCLTHLALPYLFPTCPSIQNTFECLHSASKEDRDTFPLELL